MKVSRKYISTLVLSDIIAEISVCSEEELSAHTSLKEKQSAMYGSWRYLRLVEVVQSIRVLAAELCHHYTSSRQTVFAVSDFFFFVALHNGMYR